jgi:Tol biopolymer transport system component
MERVRYCFGLKPLSLVTAVLLALPAFAGACPEWEHAIVFERDDPHTGRDIFVVQPDGSGLFHIDNNPGRTDSSPQWSPDHCRIAYAAMVSGEDEEIRIINPDGTGMVTVAGGGDLDRDWNPSWSPDGKWIVYARAPRLPNQHLGEDDLWIVPVDGSAPARRITDFRGDEHWIRWSPVDDRIAFKAEHEGNSDIWLVSPDGTGLVQLTHARVGEGHPAWSPDGKTIAYVSGGPTTEIHLMAADGTYVRQISHFGHGLPNAPQFLAFSPDGSRLVMSLSAPSGAYDKDLYILDLTTGALTNLTALFAGGEGDGAKDIWADW